ncbi:tyrosine-type recombinase/integrase [Metabacillus endolithicus]|uniref:Tyrosine-type recombinase/integrase n=1 Tax=Metabacillus endolithicus TaxID=1535204 RepID=A0ABW5BYH2_9BACI|nr:tyrosine-type recombinase/integrase [Metabacillus endolithicus]UPG65541.1 tyrosine-type recombinase/integrase [Metabacillus endolithicus]
MHYSENYDLPFYQNQFIRHLKRKHYSEETITGYSKDLKSFSEFIYFEYEGKILLEQLHRNDLLDYLTHLHEYKGYKQSSVQRHLSTLKSFYRFLVDEIGFNENIASKIKHQSIFTPLPPILTEEEIDLLLDSAKEYQHYFYVLISFLYYTGSRITATIRLEKENINFKERKLYFPKIKGGRDLYLPINDKLLPVLEDFIDNHPASEYPYVFHSPRTPWTHIDAHTVRTHLSRIKELAGIDKRVTPHILRHSMATHLTLKKVDQSFLMNILGQTDPRSTTRYQHLVVENLRDPLNKL